MNDDIFIIHCKNIEQVINGVEWCFKNFQVITDEDWYQKKHIWGLIDIKNLQNISNINPRTDIRYNIYHRWCEKFLLTKKYCFGTYVFWFDTNIISRDKLIHFKMML
jgi:hypothetical protein